MDIRCPSKLHARLTETGLVEVSCNSRFCGKEPGVVVLHRINPDTGDIVETLKFRALPTHDRKGTTC